MTHGHRIYRPGLDQEFIALNNRRIPPRASSPQCHAAFSRLSSHVFKTTEIEQTAGKQLWVLVQLSFLSAVNCQVESSQINTSNAQAACGLAASDPTGLFRGQDFT